MVAELLKKYIWLIQTLVKAGDRGLSLEELGERWESRFGSEYARRTFNNHREAIAELFDIDIECNRSTNRYFIKNAQDVSNGDAASSWLINTFTVNNILSLGKERLSGRVSVEDIPSGHKYLTAIMDAMLEGNVLSVTYQKYNSKEVEALTLHPYAVKESSKRWYLVAWCEQRQGLRVYGLDRISVLENTGGNFNIPKDWNVDKIFSSCFGVYLSDEKPREIVFRATPQEARYLKDLPIHRSQKEISSNETGVVFSIFVRPNRSLTMELLRLGKGIEVLEPASMREEIAGELRSALDLYEQ